MTPDMIKATAYLLEKVERHPAPAGEMINTYLATHKYLKGDDKKEFLAWVWGGVHGGGEWVVSNKESDKSESIALCNGTGCMG